MKQLKVLSIECTYTKGIEAFNKLCEEENIEVFFATLWDLRVSDFEWNKFDCIIYGYRFLKYVKKKEFELPCIPCIIFTACPHFQCFENTKHLVIDKQKGRDNDNPDIFYAEKILINHISKIIPYETN
jgi:hypothetical protein